MYRSTSQLQRCVVDSLFSNQSSNNVCFASLGKCSWFFLKLQFQSSLMNKTTLSFSSYLGGFDNCFHFMLLV